MDPGHENAAAAGEKEMGKDGEIRLMAQGRAQ